MPPITGINGRFEMTELRALFAAQPGLNPKELYFNHGTKTFQTGPAAARVAVNLAGPPVVTLTWLNAFGTDLSTSRDEATEDAESAVEFTDGENNADFFGDNSRVTRITETFDFSAQYRRGEGFWESVQEVSDLRDNARLYYARFFPEGRIGARPVWHGVAEARGLGNEFSPTDYYTYSLSFPLKGRLYKEALPAGYTP